MARVGRDYTCTMQLWAGYGKTVTLDNLCLALGVPSPKDGDLDGSKVFDAWREGKTVRIAEYNLRDAYAVREVYHRMLGLPRAAA
jgi:predicted PolB exonuclease-like 3'-5' exonuclease